MARVKDQDLLDPLIQAQRHRFTVDEYYRLGELGFFTEDTRVELIQGEIIDMPPIGPGHAAHIDRLNRLLGRAVADRAVVRIQSPLRISTASEPVPDIMLLRPKPDFYASGHPGPADVHLIIEVADSSLPYDRSAKASLYARAGIPEYWVVDIQARHIEVYRDPRSDGYRSRQPVDRGETISPAAFPDIRLAMEEVLL